MLKMVTQISNQIRGFMKTFGHIVPKGTGRIFEVHVRDLAEENLGLKRIILQMLQAWRNMQAQVAELGKQLVAAARGSVACRLLMTISGVGAVTAASFSAAIEDPANLRRPRSFGAWLGLTAKRYQSREVDYGGRISRRGDNHLRGLLYEAATVILTRSTADSTLRTWGLTLKERDCFKRAAVAVARKLAVIMHAMLKTGEFFNRTPVADA